ncbi:orotidine-5 -phosphate decarboxylase [Cyclospora cayetanensis]|uniref:Orotidine 5'-phosphate decarboxylase n=1 Tax=Cyclospora cayetanensis TaxID=88456 RepID=A0A1D3CZ94_9EIME|nr:orotidine-5 -phosphate decarboxylase [Cyclospora cayetanensis]
MPGVLQDRLASGRPVLCLTLNPPLCVAQEDDSAPCCSECKALQCPCTAKAALAKALAEAMKVEACVAVKLDTPYYEQFGPEGFALLASIVKKLPPHVALIIDGKRGDISNTAAAYARAFFDADAVTVSAYMGRDAITPFLQHSKDACVFAECRPEGAKGLARLSGFKASGPEHTRTPTAGGALLGLSAEVKDSADAEAVWNLRRAFPDLPFLVELHCEVSRFFQCERSSGSGAEQKPLGGLVLCLTPPNLQAVPACLQKAQAQLQEVVPT